jgi:putative ABC transport system permease protein
MRFPSVPLRALARRPLRSLLTVAGIAIAVASFIVLVSLSRGIENAWIRSLEARGVHMLALSKEAVEVLTATLDEELAGRIAGMPGVADVAGELVNVVRLEEGVHVVMRGWSEGAFLWDTIALEQGGIPGAGNRMGVVVGRTLATALEAGVGDPLDFAGNEFNIAGISASAGVMNDSGVITRLDTLQRIFDRGRKVTVFAIRLKDPGDARSVGETTSRLETAFPKLAFVATRDVGDSNEILQVLRASAWSVSLVAMVTAVVVVLNTLLMSVTERTREIGILSAIGWGPSRILCTILIEGLILSAVGSLVGAGIGIVGVQRLAAVVRLRAVCEIEIDGKLLAEAWIATLALASAGSLYPAWRAVRLRPTEALKHE